MTSLRTAPQTEAQFQRAITDLASLLGWRIAHHRPARTAKGWATPVQYDGQGLPDLLLVRERVVFAELKAERGKLTAAQSDWLEALRAAGVEAYCWRPSDWDEVVEVLKRVATAGPL